jgi:RNA polymerase sigma factor (sigma-70 family)
MHRPPAARLADPATDRFEDLFRRHHAAVVGYVRRRASSDAVDDIVGETFLVAWRRLDQVPERDLPWLLGVARNVLTTHQRGVRRRHALTARLRSRGAGGGSQPAADAGMLGAPEALETSLATALSRLAPKDREALLLVAWDGLGPRDAALVLGESAGTFRVRLHRARHRLRGLLEDRAAAPPASKPRLRVEETRP